MIPPRLILSLAFVALATSVTSAHAGNRALMMQKQQKQVAQQRKEEMARRQADRQRQDADRLARKLRPMSTVGPRQGMRASASVAATKTVRVERRDLLTIAERFGGSRGDSSRVSTLRQLLLRRQIGSGPVFGFKTIRVPAAHSTIPSTMFAFNR